MSKGFVGRWVFLFCVFVFEMVKNLLDSGFVASLWLDMCVPCFLSVNVVFVWTLELFRISMSNIFFCSN